MINNNDYEALNQAIAIAAAHLHVNPKEFERMVYDKCQEEYDESDIRQWLDDENYEYTDDDVYQILANLRDHWDATLGTWGNISSAYYRTGLNLEYKEEEDS